MNPTQAAEALRSGDYDRLRDAARNALTEPATSLLPEIPEKIQQLYAFGALYAQMSGSGSAVYGVFSSAHEARRAAEMLGKSAIVTETLPL
jgi:4-diphosphocytidyl-2-C-methyl-D-erythritol kinase